LRRSFRPTNGWSFSAISWAASRGWSFWGRREGIEEAVDRAVRRHEDVLHDAALGAGSAQAEHVPVVDDLDVVVVDERDDVRRQLSGRDVVVQREAEREVRRGVASGDVVERPGDVVAALDLDGRAGAEAPGHAEVAVVARDVGLRLLGEVGGEQVLVTRGEGVRPAA
jgi:hypothetical protein